MGITSAILLYVIACTRKRTEFPYFAIPVSFMISGLLGMIVEILVLKYQNEGNKDLVKSVALPLAIHYMFFTTGHQLFASQYL